MNIDHQVLTKFFKGHSSSGEKEEIHRWINSGDDAWKEFVKERALFDSNVLFDDYSNERVRSSRIRRISLLAGIAASLVAVIMLFSHVENKHIEQIANVMQEIHVPAGNRVNVMLPDGSVVWLSSNTKFSYPSFFHGDYREVSLDGEGYFDVAKGEKPFVVKTSKYSIEVLGTVFNVEAYSESERFVSYLYQGNIRLYSNISNDQTILHSGQKAEYENGLLRIENITDYDNCYWKDGIISIQDQSFKEIMAIFEKYFGVKIIILNDKVNDLQYTGRFRISDGIDHALKVLQNDYPFEYDLPEEDEEIYYIE